MCRCNIHGNRSIKDEGTHMVTKFLHPILSLKRFRNKGCSFLQSGGFLPAVWGALGVPEILPGGL